MGLFSSIGNVAGILTGSPIPAMIGSAFDASSAQSAQNKANDQNIDLARENRAWQEQMANSAHQREVADLTKAGLNPIISGMGGSGAAVPTPALARVENSAASSAKTMSDDSSASLARAQIASVQSQIALNTAQAAKVAEETRGVSADSDVKQVDADIAKRTAADKFGVTQKEYAARFSDAVTKQFERSNDWNALANLNDMAKAKGFADYKTALKDAEFQQEVTKAYQGKLKNAEYEAYSQFYHSDYGKNVAPYVSSAAQAAGGLSSVIRAGK